MLQIKDLLGNFKKIKDPAQDKRVMAAVINDVLKSQLVGEGDIEFKDKECIVRLRLNPAIKHKILVSKERCLESMRSALPGLTIVDIC